MELNNSCIVCKKLIQDKYITCFNCKKLPFDELIKIPVECKCGITYPLVWHDYHKKIKQHTNFLKGLPTFVSTQKGNNINNLNKRILKNIYDD